MVWGRNESGLWMRGIGSCIPAAQSQITLGQHHQSHVAVQARPEPAFIVVQSQLSLGILVESFDDPPAVGQSHLVMQCEGIKTPGEEKFVLSLVPCHGALADEPPTRGKMLATLTDSIDSHSSETLDQVPLGTFPPADSGPVILRERLQEIPGLTAWEPVLQTMGPWRSAATLVRWSYFRTRVQLHLLGQTKAGSGGHGHQMRKRRVSRPSKKEGWSP